MNILLLASSISLPMVSALTPAGRWGHQAIYVPSEAAMYVIGGQENGNQITNDVLVMPLNLTEPTFNLGSNEGLPPHAFASAAITPDEQIVVIGGMTESCYSDGLAHTLDTDTGEWSSVTPTRMVRRRGAGMMWVDNGNPRGAMMVVGGISDNLACSQTTAAYTASDVLSLPIAASSLISSRSLPSTLTGTNLAIADYALTTINGTTYMMGGQSSSGTLVGMSDIGIWTKESGWTTKKVAGDVPAGRVGASLVAHPTLDLLILHGGSVGNAGADTATALLAYLNTTSWTWSTPANVQLGTSSATSYHSSIVTPSGVMITSFGLSSTGVARPDIHYLDMRHPDPARWAWTSTWNQTMLQPYAPGSSAFDSTGSGGLSAASPSKTKLISIVVPVLVVLLIGIPLLVWFIRRKLRIVKKRRMARHFSFSSQEDDGDLQGVFSEKNRKTKTQYIFGRDANEKEGNTFTDFTTGLKGILKRVSNRPSRPSVDIDNDDHFNEKELRRMNASDRLTSLPPKSVRWEEIDFGLGKLDERRASSASAVSTTPTSPRHGPISASSSDAHEFTSSGEIMNLPLLVNLHDPQGQSSTVNIDHAYGVYGPALGQGHGSPMNDGQHPLIPSLVVLPPTNPNTPAASDMNLSSYPAMVPGVAFNPDPFADPISAAVPVNAQGQRSDVPHHDSAIGGMTPQAQETLDWSLLAQELEQRPAFRSISPTATLRSHQHPAPQSSSPVSPHSNNAPVNYANYPSRAVPRSNRVPVPPIQPGQVYYPAQSQQRRVSSPVSFPVANPSTAISTPPRSPSPNPGLQPAAPPQLPPLDLGNSPGFSRVITLVNPKTGRRTSEIIPPISAHDKTQSQMTSIPMSISPSSLPSALPYLSSTVASNSGFRQSFPPPLLSREVLPQRRGSLPPLTGFQPSAQTGDDSSPSTSGSNTPTPASIENFEYSGILSRRRSSTPIVPVGVGISPAANPVRPRGLSGSGLVGSVSGNTQSYTQGQSTIPSRLRVVNPSDTDSEDSTHEVDGRGSAI